MAQLFKRAYLVAPNQLLYQQKRYRGKINVGKPRPEHYTKALANEFLTPFYHNPIANKPWAEVCKNVVMSERKTMKETEYNPYERIIAREVCNWFEHSKMIAIFHRNSITGPEEYEFRLHLKRVNMYYKFYSQNVMKLACTGSPYEVLLPLFNPHFGLVFSPETNVRALQKIVKKFPNVVLMAGILDNQLLNLEDFFRYGNMDLTMVQVRLVQTLQNAAGNTLNQHLTHHQSTLVTRLKQIGTQDESDENEQSVPV